jgi:hypothetical protein
VQATQTVLGQHEDDLNFEIGDMIAVTYFNKSEPFWLGVLLDENYRSVWWEFEELAFKEAILLPYGRFPSHAVRLP